MSRKFLSHVLAASAAVFLTATGPAAATDLRFEFAAPEDVRDALFGSSLLASADREGVTDTQELLAAANADYARLIGVLYDRGYYGAVISIRVDGREAAEIPPLSAPETVNDISTRVTAGPRYLFGRVRAAPLAPGTVIPEGFARGQPAALNTIRGTAEEAVDAWRRSGHAKADLAGQRIVARHGEKETDADLSIAPGPRLTFGAITVSGNEIVRTRRIRTIAGLEEGPVYDPKEIEGAERRLRRTGSFQSVVVEEADEIAPGDTLPMNINVVEQVPRRFGFGGEFSTIEGVRLSGFWLHRNFLGGAERFRVDGEIAGVGGGTGGTDYGVNVRYERPATPRPDVDFFSEIGFERLDEPDFTSTTGEFKLGFTRYATEELVVDFGLGFLYSEVDDDFGQEIYRLANLPLGAVYDRRSDPLNPKQGYFVDLEITPFAGLSGTASGVRTELDARYYKSVGPEEKLTFAGRLQLGSLAGPDLLESPPTYRFYSGGGGTVRGQDYQSLAIDLGGGDRSGGKSFLGLSAEARRSVTDTIEVVGFADWGYVGAEDFPDFSGDSHAGAGIGVRYNTGIGPIRLDLAVPVSGDTEASDYYIYIGIGQAF